LATARYVCSQMAHNRGCDRSAICNAVDTILKLAGYFSFGVALLGVGAMLFGSAGFWGFLVFVLGFFFGLLWLLLGLAVGKLGRLREILFPSTREAELKRRLLLAAMKVPMRTEAGSALDRLRRLEHVWPAIERHLGERLSPSELTYQRYQDTAQRARGRALQELEDATSLIESLGAMRKVESESGESQAAAGKGFSRAAGREHLAALLADSETAIAGLERLNLALLGDLRTGSASRDENLDDLARDLDELASRAHRYVKGR